MELFNPCNDAAYPAKTVAYTGTAGSTGTWPPGPGSVLVWCDTAAYVRVGEGVTATTSDTPLPANTPVPFKIPLMLTGGPWRVSAIQIGTAGNLYAKPMSAQ